MHDKGNPDCAACGGPFYASGLGTGYGIRKDGARVCYSCCADDDKRSMLETGRATLYLVKRNGRWRITNWPGSYDVRADYVRRFNHPFAREAWIARFVGPDGTTWSAKNIGDSQIAHCRRVRA